MSEVPLCVSSERTRLVSAAKMEHLYRVSGHLSERQGQNLALSVLYVPRSFDSGGVYSRVHAAHDGSLHE